MADSGTCGITIRSGSSSFGTIYFSDATSGNGEYDGYIDYNHSNSNLRFGTGAATRLTIDSTGVEVTGKLTFAGDGVSNGIELGAGADLLLYHDDTDAYLDNNKGDFYIRNSGSNSNQVYISGKGGENGIIVNGDGAVELYHDNSKKFETTADGADFSGTGSIKVPVGTTAQRNASPTAGDFRYNSTTGDFEGYTDEWGAIAGGGGGSGIATTKYSPIANATIQIGLGTAQHHELRLSAGITTVTTTGGTFGEAHSLVLVQPSSGICTVGFSTFFQFPSGSIPSMSEGNSKVDLVSFVVKDIARNAGTGATELLASAGLNYSN